METKTKAGRFTRYALASGAIEQSGNIEMLQWCSNGAIRVRDITRKNAPDGGVIWQGHNLNEARAAFDKAVRANPLDAMTWDRWQLLGELQREKLRDLSGLHPALLPYKGARVECERYGERVRFWVGMSTGWKPCLLAVHNTRSSGGDAIRANENLGEIRVIRWGRA